MSGKVDFSRPYGQVYGDADHAFEQDGKLFDANGNEVAGPAVEPKVPRAYTKKAKPAPETPMDGELAAQMAG